MDSAVSPIEVFCSYAEEDDELWKGLYKHLRSLERQGQIVIRHRAGISPGKEYAQEIATYLNAAQIILLLISPDFLNFDHGYDVELKRAIERHKVGQTRVIPIILRPIDWKNEPFANLEPLPTNRLPITTWSNRDEAFNQVAEGIHIAVEEVVQDALESRRERSQGLQVSSQPARQESAEPVQGLERPATVFLSYAREDVEEVRRLQLQLKVRGMQVQQNSIGRAEVIHVIEHEADAFVVYITPNYLASELLRDEELDAALQRWKHDPAFKIIPVLSGLSLPELQQFCAAHDLQDLLRFQPFALPIATSEGTGGSTNQHLREVAVSALEATLALRWRRVRADRDYEPWLRFCTFDNRPSTSCLDLDLDWWDLFHNKERLPPLEEWAEILFPALQDVKSALSARYANHHLHIVIKAELPAAFAFGFIFRSPSSFHLLPESDKGPWRTIGTSAASPSLHSTALDGAENGDRHVAIVEIAISNDTALATLNHLRTSQTSYSYHIRYDLPDGPDHIDGVKDAAHALAIARYIGRELRKLCGQGVTHIHLFAAVPAALAVVLGHQFNALCSISVYEYVKDEDGNGLYKWACILR